MFAGFGKLRIRFARRLDIHEARLTSAAAIICVRFEDRWCSPLLVKVAVTVWSGSHWISGPSEHQHRSLCATSTRPSCERADWRQYGALGYS